MVTAARPLRSRRWRCSRRVLTEVVELRLEGLDPAHQPSAVDLQPGLATAEAHADAAPLLGQLGGGAAPQPRQPVAEQGQLDLRLALQRVGVLGEDVEDHGRAVDGGATEQLLQVVLLARGQLVVEHDGVGVDLEAQLVQLGRLALADEPGVVGVVAPLHQPADDVGAGGVDQRLQLVQAGLGRLVVAARERHADDDDPFPHAALDQRGAKGFVVGVAHGRGISIVATYVAGPVSVACPGCGRSSATIASPPSMCTTSSPSSGRASPQRGRRPRRGHGPRPARLGDPDAAFVDAHGDGVRLWSRRHDLEVDVGDAPAERRQIDRLGIVDGDDAVRVADAHMGHRAVRQHTEGGPAGVADRSASAGPSRRTPGPCTGRRWAVDRPAAARRR